MANLADLTVSVSSRGVSKTTSELRQMSAEGSRAEKMAGRLGKAIGALAIVAAAATAFKAATGVTMEFSQSIADLSAITGATGKDLKFYTEQAKEIGRTTSLSASQAATAFKLIASAKPDLLSNAAALNEVTKSAVTLAEATGMALPDAAKALGGALNQFQLDASKADDVINILAASSKLGTAEVASVTEALTNAGPAAAALGIDLAETVAVIQGFAKAGITGADAGTKMKQVLFKLEKQSGEGTTPSIDGISKALENLGKQNLSVSQLMEIFGEEAAGAAASILGQVDAVKELNTSLRGTDTAMEQAATRMDTLQGDLLALGSAITGVAIEGFGSDVEGAIRKIVQSVTKGVNALTESMDKVITVVKVLSALLAARMAGAIAGYITNMNWATAATLRTSTAMGTMTAAAGLAKGAMALLGGPVGVIALVITGLLTYTNSTDDAEKASDRFSTKLKELKTNIKDLSLAQVEGRIVELKLEMEKLADIKVPASPFANATGGDNSYLGVKSKEARLAVQLKLNDAYQLETDLMTKQNIEVKKLADSTKVLTKAELAAQSAAEKAAKAEALRLKQKEELEKENEKLTLSMREQRIAIAEEMELVKLSGREWAVRNAQLEVGAEALNNLDENIKLVAQALLEEKIALIDATEEQKAFAKAAEESAQAQIAAAEDAGNKLVAAKEEETARIKDLNEQLYGEISNTYLNLIENGSDAFDNIGDSFKSMINNMIANLLALATQQFVVNIVGNVGVAGSVADLISGGGFGGGLGSLFSGGGGLGSIISDFGGTLTNLFGGGGDFLSGLGSIFGFGGVAGTGAVTGAGLAGLPGAIHLSGAASGAAAGGLGGLFGGITLGGLATAGIGLLLAPVLGDALGSIFDSLFGGSDPKERFSIDQYAPHQSGLENTDWRRILETAFGTVQMLGENVSLKGMEEAIQSLDDVLASVLSAESIDNATQALRPDDVDFVSGDYAGNDASTQLAALKSRYTVILDSISEGLGEILADDGTQDNFAMLTVTLAQMGEDFKDGVGLFAHDLAAGVNEFLNFEDIINELPEQAITAAITDLIGAAFGGANTNFNPLNPSGGGTNPFADFGPSPDEPAFDAINSVWEQIIAKFEDLAKEGEELADTYSRVSLQVAVFNKAIDATGNNLQSTVFELIDISEAVIEAAGGLEAFTAGADAYYQHFVDGGQQYFDLIGSIADQFAAADVPMVNSAEEFANLLAGLDLTTEAGQNAYAAMLNLADSANVYFTLLDQMAHATDGITGLSESIKDSLLSEEDLYDKRKAEAEALSDLIGTMTDPAEIAAALAEIEKLNNLLYGSLAPDQQEELGSEIADYLDEVAEIAAARLEELTQMAANDVALSEQDGQSSENLVAAADEMASATSAFQSGVDKFDGVVEKLSNAVASIAAAASNLNADPDVGFGA